MDEERVISAYIESQGQIRIILYVGPDAPTTDRAPAPSGKHWVTLPEDKFSQPSEVHFGHSDEAEAIANKLARKMNYLVDSWFDSDYLQQISLDIQTEAPAMYHFVLLYPPEPPTQSELAAQSFPGIEDLQPLLLDLDDADLSEVGTDSKQMTSYTPIINHNTLESELTESEQNDLSTNSNVVAVAAELIRPDASNATVYAIYHPGFETWKPVASIPLNSNDEETHMAHELVLSEARTVYDTQLLHLHPT